MNEIYDLNRDKTFNSLWFLIFMIYYCLGILPVNLDNLLINLPGTTKLGIGISAALYLLFVSTSLIFFGYFEDKITEKNMRKKVFIAANLLWVIAYGFISISISFHFYLIFTIIGAIGIGAFVPIGYSMISDYYLPKERGRKYGSIHMGLILGTGAGIILGELLGSYAGPNGWRFAYGIGCFFGLAAVINFILKGRDPKRAQAEPEFKDFEDNFSYDYKIDIKRLSSLFKRKSIASILVYNFFSGIAVSTIGTWGIFYMTSKFGGTYAEVSAMTLYLLTGAGILPGTILGGKIGDYFYRSGKIRGRIVLTFGGLVLGIICLFMFYLLPTTEASPLENMLTWIFFLIIGFLGFFFVSLSIGNVFAIYSEISAPESRSTLNAFHNVMINIGGIFGNLIFSSLIESDISLMPYAMGLVLFFWLIGTALWGITYFSYPRDSKKIRELMEQRRIELQQNLN